MDVLTIDLNADLGEAFGAYTAGPDAELLPLISSANIACGFHAGDPQVMQATVARAHALGVSIGAHPGYPDLVGFGRRPLDATADEIYADVLYQIGALLAFCRAAGAPIRYVKPHGALYNRAAVDEVAARAIVRAILEIDLDLAVFAQPGSALLRQARQAGLAALAEVFPDRAVNRDGTLVSRRQPGAMIEEPEQVAARALRMVREHQITAIDGASIAIECDTLCLHGDAPGAVERARALRQALNEAGIRVAAPWSSTSNDSLTSVHGRG